MKAVSSVTWSIAAFVGLVLSGAAAWSETDG